MGEIRHTLESHPAVYDCHIDVKETGESKQIVAFYRAAQPLSQKVLKTHLKAQLTYYMVPTIYIFVKEYPRTPNGKIDTRRLLALVDQQVEDMSHFAPPQTAREKQMAEMWQKLLKVKQVGLQDDFFDLGGHSILAVEMLIQVREAFGVEISPNELFQNGTIAHICRLIEALEGGTAVASPRTFKSLISVHAASDTSQPNLFCVHGGGGNILFMQEWKKHMPELKLNLYGFQARGIDGIAQPHSSIEEMAHDYLQEMREYQPSGPYFIAGYSGGGSIALEMASILRQSGEEVPIVLLLDSYHPDVQNRRLTPAEHLRNALEYPLDFVYQRIARQVERVRQVFRQRALREILENKRHIPLELRDMYVSSHLSDLRRRHKIESYDGSVILYRATKVWQVYDHVGRDLGWGNTLKCLKIVDVEGDHDDLIREPNVRNLLLQVSEAVRHHRK
ncbi:MAG: thioesterase domain-containing protein [Chloroflexota bacterium]